jgi:putative membrane protein insertion efficiency factor
MTAISRYLLGLVERYRSSSHAHKHRGSCRFSPTCSSFAIQALEERSLPVAVASIAWRILRCNPLVRVGTKDPVRSQRRIRPRANSVRTAASLLFLSGLTVMFLAGAAVAQSITGGCNAQGNGRPIQELSKDNPLKVSPGERVRAVGTAPGGQPAKGNVNVDYKLEVIQGILGVDARSETHVGNGGQWTSTLNVDKYLQQGSGLYHVTGDVRSAQDSWSCAGDFYVNLNGKKTIAYAGGGVAAVGLLMMAGSASAPAPSAQDPDVANAGPSGDESSTLGIKKDPGANATATAGLGCIIVVEEILMDLFGESLGGPFFILVWPLFGAAPDTESNTQRIWRKGHPVLGFFGGLLMGLGVAVAGQQLGYWTLNIGTLIAGPVLAAILGAIRGRRGSAFKVTYQEGPPAPSAETVANA